MELVIGETYNFNGQPDLLKYIGKQGNWHQFEQLGKFGVWAEILDDDLRLIEKSAKK